MILQSSRKQQLLDLAEGGDENAANDLRNEYPGKDRWEWLNLAPWLAVDFETYYDAEYSLTKLGYWQYTHHQDFDAYLVAVSDGLGSVAVKPAEFPWDRLHGKTLIAHNAIFDRAVFERLQELGTIPAHVQPRRWYCTAALSRFLQCPGDLAGAAKAILEVDVNKSERDAAKGNTRTDSNRRAYAKKDAEICAAIWERAQKYWPEHERQIWEITAGLVKTGVGLDVQKVLEQEKAMLTKAEELRRALPWCGTHAPTSPIALHAACFRIGIEPPPSTEDGDPATEDWVQRNINTDAPTWLRHMQWYRRCNRRARVLRSMLDRRIGEDRLEVNLIYCGAGTGRWSGGGGLNLQNLNSSEEDGCDLRGCLIPEPGHKLAIIDFAQIEARIVLWLAGDTKTLAMVAEGLSVYEAHARATMGWNKGKLKEENPQLYKLAKARVLGLGFGCGAAKFVTVAKIMGGLDLSFTESQDIVEDYRRSNPGIVNLWQTLENNARANIGKSHAIRLPSGRTLKYRNVEADEEGKLTAEVEKGTRSGIYGGLLAENVTQAAARDLFGEGLIYLVNERFNPCLLVHDEYVLEVPDEGGQAQLDQAMKILTTWPSDHWSAGLPVGCEGKLVERYEK